MNCSKRVGPSKPLLIYFDALPNFNSWGNPCYQMMSNYENVKLPDDPLHICCIWILRGCETFSENFVQHN